MLRATLVLSTALLLLSACASAEIEPYPAFDGFSAHGGLGEVPAMDAPCPPQLALKGHC